MPRKNKGWVSRKAEMGYKRRNNAQPVVRRFLTDEERKKFGLWNESNETN